MSRTDLPLVLLQCISLKKLRGLKRMVALWRDEDLIQLRSGDLQGYRQMPVKVFPHYPGTSNSLVEWPSCKFQGL